MSTTIGCRRLQGIWGCLPTSDDGFHTCAHQRAPLHLPASLTILGDQQWRTGGVQWPLEIGRKESNRRNHQTGEGMTSRRFQGSVQQASAIGLSYSACGCTQMLSHLHHASLLAISPRPRLARSTFIWRPQRDASGGDFFPLPFPPSLLISGYIDSR